MTKLGQILTIYVKNHEIHVETKSEMSFPQNTKKTTSQIIQDLDAEKMLTLVVFGPDKPKTNNIHIYHFHVLESPNL